ncbi:lysozyme [Shinella sp. CPCC 101442]|uniref:lysozyme n=1 Tax=Shinella sp. CPCC 101442 TaxID=2932265 RepID=UPI0021529CEF|nr:lysozyme [Shinella sp. CPCC 101442]MCR6502611.1 lysozyme [Shinella sp. CPCC 101442]
MTTTLQVQERLIALGYYVGPKGADGDYGKETIGGILSALEDLAELQGKQFQKPGEQTTSAAGRKAITQREGNVLTAYQDSVGVWTIGVGHTSAAGAPAVAKGMKITAAESDEILSRDLKTFEAGVRAAVKVPVNQNEFDALVSLAFNIGVGAFSKSTLVKKLNAGDRAGAADQFLVWNKAGGKVLQGLTARRQAERKQFLS